MSEIDRMLAANAEWAERFPGSRDVRPARRVAVVACMDSRMPLFPMLGLEVGDAHVIRNAGGRVSEDAIRSLAISERLLGTTEVAVIHHTDCGMMTFQNEDLTAKIKEDLGVDASGRDFLPFSDLEQSVRDDVQRIRDSELIPDDIPVTGAIYDVRTGELQEVVRG